MADLGARYRDLASRLDVVRGRGAYGRKPNRAVLNEIAKDGPVTVFHEDRSTGDIGIETVQNVTPILEANAADYNSGNDGYTPSRDMRKVASIPLVGLACSAAMVVCTTSGIFGSAGALKFRTSS